ncbi:hypothetical protein D3C73_1333790 [compost metagenome]
MLRLYGHDLMGFNKSHRRHILKAGPIHSHLYLHGCSGARKRNFTRSRLLQLIPIHRSLNGRSRVNPPPGWLQLDPICAALRVILKSRFSTVADRNVIGFSQQIGKGREAGRP